MKDPDNKKKWIIDEEAAAAIKVKRAFLYEENGGGYFGLNLGSV